MALVLLVLPAVATAQDGASAQRNATKTGAPSGAIVIPASTPMTPADANFDPDWDWTLNQAYDLYVDTQVGLVRHPNKKLPYYTTNGPAGTDFNSEIPGVRDISPAEGWVLLFRDFGTPTRAVSYPKIILYNRHRGVLRFFYYNGHFPEAYTYGLVSLKAQLTQNAPAILTFTDEGDNVFLDDYDAERKEVFIGSIEDGIESLQKRAEEKDKWYSDHLNNLLGLNLFKVIPAIGALASVFDVFSLGGHGNNVQPLRFKGEISLSGEIVSKLSLTSFLLRVPGANHLGNDNLPFYDKPLGIFSLATKPVVRYFSQDEYAPCLQYLRQNVALMGQLTSLETSVHTE